MDLSFVWTRSKTNSSVTRATRPTVYRRNNRFVYKTLENWLVQPRIFMNILPRDWIILNLYLFLSFFFFCEKIIIPLIGKQFKLIDVGIIILSRSLFIIAPPYYNDNNYYYYYYHDWIWKLIAGKYNWN